MASTILILGAGITGLTSALALQKYLPDPKPKIKIIELRPASWSIGGAVNLTPKALRYLSEFGITERFEREGIGAECRRIDIHDLSTGQQYAHVDFQEPDGGGIGDPPFYARRVMRWQIQQCLLEAVEADEHCEVIFGKQVVSIHETDADVTLRFSDSTEQVGDLLLGCDGLYSATRSVLVDPERRPKYTGIAVAQSTGPAASLPWPTTGLVSSRKGSLLVSSFDSGQSHQYLAAVMEVNNVDTREGWKAKGTDQEAVREDLSSRFRCSTIPELEQLLEKSGDWFLYPVYMLPNGGKWISRGKRAILLGDAAHAMPPQGESTGICIEDAIVFARVMRQHKEKSLASILQAYDDFRRTKVETAHAQATAHFENVKDKGWLAYGLLKLLTPWVLWWTAAGRRRDFAEDLTGLELKVA